MKNRIRKWIIYILEKYFNSELSYYSKLSMNGKKDNIVSFEWKDKD